MGPLDVMDSPILSIVLSIAFIAWLGEWLLKQSGFSNQIDGTWPIAGFLFSLFLLIIFYISLILTKDFTESVVIILGVLLTFRIINQRKNSRQAKEEN